MFGLPFNWDWSREWDLQEDLTGWETSFWIGMKF